MLLLLLFRSCFCCCCCFGHVVVVVVVDVDAVVGHVAVAVVVVVVVGHVDVDDDDQECRNNLFSARNLINDLETRVRRKWTPTQLIKPTPWNGTSVSRDYHSCLFLPLSVLQFC